MIDEQTLLAYEQTDYKFSDITINIGVLRYSPMSRPNNHKTKIELG